jgi:hypothetical protein
MSPELDRLTDGHNCRAKLTPFGRRYSVMTIIPERGGQDFVGHDVILVAADTDPTLATV